MPKKLETCDLQTPHLLALGKIAGNMAHELNNPLSIIRMNAEIILDYCGPSAESEKILDKCHKIISTADHMAGLIRALKSISESSMSPAFKWTNLSSLVQDLEDLCAQRFKAANIAFEIHLEEMQNCELFIDRAQISQALNNLLSHSFDSIRSSEQKWVRLSGRLSEESLYFTITDSGSRENFASPSIGLMLVQCYAASHGGTLRSSLVDSHPTLTLEFPRSKVQPARG